MRNGCIDKGIEAEEVHKMCFLHCVLTQNEEKGADKYLSKLDLFSSAHITLLYVLCSVQESMSPDI